VSQENDTDVAHYNFNAHQPILVIFGTDVADRVCYRIVLGGGGRRRQKAVQDVLRIAADSIEKSVVALRQLLAGV